MMRETYLADVLADATRTFRYRSGVAWLLGHPDAVGPEPVAARPPASTLPYVRARRSSSQAAWAPPPQDDWAPHAGVATAPMPTSVAALDDCAPATSATQGHLPLPPTAPSAFGDVRSEGAETPRPEEFFIVGPDPLDHDAASVATSLPKSWAEAPGMDRATRVPGGLDSTPRTGRATPGARGADRTAVRPASADLGEPVAGPAAPTSREVASGVLTPTHHGAAKVLAPVPGDIPIASPAPPSRRSQPPAASEASATRLAMTIPPGAPAVGQLRAADILVAQRPVRTPDAAHLEPGGSVPFAAVPSEPRSGRLRLAATATLDDASEALEDAPWPRARLATKADTAFACVAEDVVSREPFGEPLPPQSAIPPVPDVVQILPAGDESYGGATAFWTRRHMRRWQLGLLR